MKNVKHKIINGVFEVFKRLQQNQEKTLNVKYVYDLIDLLNIDFKIARFALQQCYLKILKELSKSTKKSPERFQKLTQKLFEFVVKMLGQQKQNGRLKRKIDQEQVIKFIEHFMVFFGEGLQSNLNPIKLFCGRLQFHLIKCLPKKVICSLEKSVLQMVTKSIIGLLPSHKQLFIKMASLLQYYSQELRCQIKKMAHQQGNDNIRKLAISNLLVKNLQDICDRLRDRCKQNRIMCIKKMRKNQIMIQGINGWKVIYDGISSRDPDLKKQFIYYIVQRINANTCYEDKQKYKRRSSLLQSKQEFNSKLKYKINQFFKTIDVRQILIYPHLNRALTELITQAILYIAQPQLISYYRHLFSYITHRNKQVKTQEESQSKPNRNALKNIDPDDMLMLRCICNVMKSDKRGQVQSQLINFLQECYPCAKDLQLALIYFHEQGKLFHVYQTLEIISYQVNIDQGGRQKLRKVLKNMLLDRAYYKNQIKYNLHQFNDVYYEVDQRRVKLKGLQQGQHDIKIIRDNLDLIGIILRLFKRYSNQSFFQTQLCQITSEIMAYLNSSDQTDINLCKKHLMAQKKFKECLKEEMNQQTVRLWKQQADRLKNEIEITQNKIAILLKNIAFHCNNPPLQITQPLIQMINKMDTNSYSYALCLQSLGTFCLLNKKLAAQYYKMFFKYLPQKQSKSIQKQYRQVVSMKIISDLVQRFNILKTNAFQQEEVNPDLFEKKLTNLMFANNQLTRNMAIQIAAKLLYNQKFPNSNIFFLYLLLLWWDTKIHKDGNAKAVQIISVFFKKYPQKNQLAMDSTELNFQIFFSLLTKIHKQKKQFNQQIIEYKIDHGQLIQKCLSIAINILSSISNSLYLFYFFYFLLEECSEKQKYFDKNIHYLEKIKPQYLSLLAQRMQQMLDNIQKKQRRQKWARQIKRIKSMQVIKEKVDVSGRKRQRQKLLNIMNRNLKDLQIVVDGKGQSSDQSQEYQPNNSLKRYAHQMRVETSLQHPNKRIKQQQIKRFAKKSSKFE